MEALLDTGGHRGHIAEVDHRFLAQSFEIYGGVAGLFGMFDSHGSKAPTYTTQTMVQYVGRTRRLLGYPVLKYREPIVNPNRCSTFTAEVQTDSLVFRNAQTSFHLPK